MAPRATRQVLTISAGNRAATVSVWTRDLHYALVPDSRQPHGFRLVDSADTIASLQKKLVKKLSQNGKL